MLYVPDPGSRKWLFEKQDAREKRRLLNFLVSNCSWANGELSVTLKQPFDLIAETAMLDAKKKAAGDASNGLSEIWLPNSFPPRQERR